MPNGDGRIVPETAHPYDMILSRDVLLDGNTRCNNPLLDSLEQAVDGVQEQEQAQGIQPGIPLNLKAVSNAVPIHIPVISYPIILPLKIRFCHKNSKVVLR